MANYLEDNYNYFRPLLQELSELNIDFSKKAGQEEIKVLKRWLENNWWEDISEDRFGIDLCFRIVEYLDDKNRNISTERQCHTGKNISSVLDDLRKEKTRKGVSWILEETGGKLEGYTIASAGQQDRRAKKQFLELLNELNFPKEVREIFVVQGKCRFNAVGEPEEFVEKIARPIFTDYEYRRIVEGLCKTDGWLRNYQVLNRLLKIWRKQENSRCECSFEKVYKTIVWLQQLIPVVSKEGNVKRADQYEYEKEQVERAMYDYYKERTYVYSHLQQLDQNIYLAGRLEKVMNFVHSSDLTRIQRDFLTNRFAEIIDDIAHNFQWFMEAGRQVIKVPDDSRFKETYEFYQEKWKYIIR